MDDKLTDEQIAALQAAAKAAEQGGDPFVPIPEGYVALPPRQLPDGTWETYVVPVETVLRHSVPATPPPVIPTVSEATPPAPAAEGVALSTPIQQFVNLFEAALAEAERAARVNAIRDQAPLVAVCEFVSQLSDQLAAVTRDRDALAGAVMHVPTLYHEAYEFGQHHHGRDVPEARRVCLKLMGEILDTLPEDRRNELDYEGTHVLESYLAGEYDK